MRLVSCKYCGVVIDYDVLKSRKESNMNDTYDVPGNGEWFQCRSCYKRNKVEFIWTVEIKAVPNV